MSTHTEGKYKVMDMIINWMGLIISNIYTFSNNHDVHFKYFKYTLNKTQNISSLIMKLCAIFC